MIRISQLLKEAAETFTATNKKTGKTSVFKSKESRDAAVKAGTHTDIKDKGEKPKAAQPKVNIFNQPTDTKKSKDDISKKKFSWKAPDTDGIEAALPNHNAKFDKDEQGRVSIDIINKKTGKVDYTVVPNVANGLPKILDKKTGEYVAGGKTNGELADALSKLGNQSKPASKGGPGSGRKPKADKPAEEPKKHSEIDTNSPETRTIQTYSNARPQAIADFVNKHKLDANALGNFLQKGSLSDRMDFITALVGEPGNKYEKKIIDKFAEKEEDGNKGGFQTPKRQGNPQVNKKVRQMANDLGITPNDYATSEYKKKMMQAAVEALTDANFHQEARELVAKLEGKPEWVKRPEYGTPEYDKWVKSGVYDSVYFNGDEDTRKLGIAASQESSWDGVEAIDSLAFTLRMAGFGKEADTIQSIFDNKPYMKKESMSLKKMMRK